jgi:hypothetical protein
MKRPKNKVPEKYSQKTDLVFDLTPSGIDEATLT